MKLDVETGKFWSFKDTKNYKNKKRLNNNRNVVRTFVFDKPFLAEIQINNETKYVVPTTFMSDGFPSGFYTGICDNQKIHFYDSSITRIL